MTDALDSSFAMQDMPVSGDNHAAARTSTRADRAWPWALAAATGLGLMLALGLVVQNVVRQANTRHADTAARSEALWRCNSVPGRDAREACRSMAATVTAGTAR